MSSETVLKVFNLLVHYGDDNERNFRHLLEDGFFNLVDTEVVKNSRGKHSYLDNVEYLKTTDTYYMSGTFFKEANINVKHQRGAKNKAIVDPIDKDVYPSAMFLLDLVKHRIYWFYPRNETYPPQAYDFASYIKKKVYNSIKEEYISMFEGEFKLKKIKISEDLYVDYKKRRLLETNMTRKLFTIKVVPIIDTVGIKKAILDKNFLVKSVIVKGYLPNSTKKDGKELKEWSDPFDKVTEKAKDKLGASFKAEFKGLSNGLIEKKENVISLIDELAMGKNYDLTVKMQDRNDSKKNKVIHSNPNDGNYADMGLKKILVSALSKVKDLIINAVNIDKEIHEEFSDVEIAEAVDNIEGAVITKEIKVKSV